MKLIEADKVKLAMKDYWKAQVDKALTLIDGNEANKRINSYLEHNHELLKAIDELPSAEPDTTTHDSIPAETGKNDSDGTSGDCISRQAALEKIRKMQTYKMFAGDDLLLIDQAEAQTELMMLPSAQPEQQWIPCSERLPKEREWIGTKRFGTTISDEVYVTFEAPDGQRFADHISFQNGKLSRSDEHRMKVLYKGAKPIAWKPQPEPYQGGEQ